jgi:hypothetical protein
MASITLTGISAGDTIREGDTVNLTFTPNQDFVDLNYPIPLSLVKEVTITSSRGTRISQSTIIPNLYTIDPPSSTEAVNISFEMPVVPGAADASTGLKGNTYYIVANYGAQVSARTPGDGSFFSILVGFPILFTLPKGSYFYTGEQKTITWNILDRPFLDTLLGISGGTNPTGTIEIGVFTTGAGDSTSTWTSSAILGSDIDLTTGSLSFTVPDIVSRGDYRFRMFVTNTNGKVLETFSEMATFLAPETPVPNAASTTNAAPASAPNAASTTNAAPASAPNAASTPNAAPTTNAAPAPAPNAAPTTTTNAAPATTTNAAIATLGARMSSIEGRLSDLASALGQTGGRRRTNRKRSVRRRKSNRKTYRKRAARK